MNSNQVPPSYSRPTQVAVGTQRFALFYVILSSVLFLSVGFFFITSLFTMVDKIVLGVSFVGTVVFLLSLLALIQNFLSIRKFDKTALTTSGSVVELWKTANPTYNAISSNNTSTDLGGCMSGCIGGLIGAIILGTEDYYFAYHFTVSGNSFGAYQKINSSQYNALKVGDTVTIRYLSTDPIKSRAKL